MAFKLLRLLRYTELPGKGWTGWHFTRGLLVTPEGRTIAPHESAWWSMLVRKAETWLIMARDLNWHKAQVRNEQIRDAVASGLAGAASVPQAGLVSVSTKQTFGLNQSSQNDVIMTSWPTLYAYQLDSTPTPEPAVTGSASASTPCSAWPSTPTSGHLKTHQNRENPVKGISAPLPAPSLTAPPGPQNRHQGPRQHLASRSSPRPSGGKSPGWSAPPASTEARTGGAA
jgi:Phage protein